MNGSRSSVPRSLSYILRLWETRSVPPDPDGTWRLSLENCETGERIGFSNLETLLDFLRHELWPRPEEEQVIERD